MGPNPIMQARSDFYDDDSIMYTYVCVCASVCTFIFFGVSNTFIRIYLLLFGALSVHSFAFSQIPVIKWNFLIYFRKMWVILSKNINVCIHIAGANNRRVE